MAVIVTAGPPFADTRLIASTVEEANRLPIRGEKGHAGNPRTFDAHCFQPIERPDEQHEPALFDVHECNARSIGRHRDVRIELTR